MFEPLAAEQPRPVDFNVRSEESCLDRIVAVFRREFSERERTELCPGAQEPYYQPASSLAERHQIFSRSDYPASVLHEVAHWCVAGPQRRLLPDFGYWYATDGRNAQQQQKFQRVEVKPQAIEWAFSRAVGLRFQVSIDNLTGYVVDPFGFQLAVWQQAQAYDLSGLPGRAERFVLALKAEFHRECYSLSLAALR
ncbi:MAG: elongation factor P hydroxylase [Bermanella sp.]|jgi:elongation factor P hydroxylase